MPRVGDGTGLGSMPPEEEGLNHTGGDTPEKAGAPYSPADGTGPVLDSTGNRTAPVRSAK